jgi:hypothetical protein
MERRFILVPMTMATAVPKIAMPRGMWIHSCRDSPEPIWTSKATQRAPAAAATHPGERPPRHAAVEAILLILGDRVRLRTSARSRPGIAATRL